VVVDELQGPVGPLTSCDFSPPVVCPPLPHEETSLPVSSGPFVPQVIVWDGRKAFAFGLIQGMSDRRYELPFVLLPSKHTSLSLDVFRVFFCS